MRVYHDPELESHPPLRLLRVSSCVNMPVIVDVPTHALPRPCASPPPLPRGPSQTVTQSSRRCSPAVTPTSRQPSRPLRSRSRHTCYTPHRGTGPLLACLAFAPAAPAPRRMPPHRALHMTAVSRVFPHLCPDATLPGRTRRYAQGVVPSRPTATRSGARAST